MSGYSSLAIVAAAAFAGDPALPALAVVLEGGHGEVFVQGFTAAPFATDGALASLRPDAALALLAGRPAIGNGVARLRAIADGHALHDCLPRAADAQLLPAAFKALPPRPNLWPRARRQAADTGMSTTLNMVALRSGAATDLPIVDAIMQEAFDPRFGEAWTRSQCLGILALPGIWLTIASIDGVPAGFAMARGAVDEAELLLLATLPVQRRRGVGKALLRSVMAECQTRGVGRTPSRSSRGERRDQALPRGRLRQSW